MARFHVEIQWESREEKHRSSKYKILLSFPSIAEACNKRDLQKGLWNRAIKINSNKKASGKKKLARIHSVAERIVKTHALRNGSRKDLVIEAQEKNV